MIRIGFDPILEAEQHNKQLLKQAEYDRMVKEAGVGFQFSSVTSSRMLAMLGRQMASLGMRLAERYGDGSQAFADFVAHHSEPCG
jgi:hypothetical protein